MTGDYTNKKSMEIKRLNSDYKKLPRRVSSWSLSHRFVPGDGPLNAKVMLVGQAPGRNEDIQGRPFVGAAGKFLNRLMHIAGLDRDSVYISSVVQFFPPMNRLPRKDEVELCKGFLFRQIRIVNPKIIVLLGSLACKTVLGIDKVSKNRGSIIRKHGRIYFISMHPAAAVRIRTKMPVMEKDFRTLGDLIKKELE